MIHIIDALVKETFFFFLLDIASTNASTQMRVSVCQGAALILPGAFNGLTGRSIADCGFKACYISGAALNACKGMPDIGLLSIRDFCDIISEVSQSSGLPIYSELYCVKRHIAVRI